MQPSENITPITVDLIGDHPNCSRPNGPNRDRPGPGPDREGIAWERQAQIHLSPVLTPYTLHPTPYTLHSTPCESRPSFHARGPGTSTFVIVHGTPKDSKVTLARSEIYDRDLIAASIVKNTQ